MSGAAPDCCDIEEDARSPIARLDPRTRLLGAIGFVGGVLAQDSLSFRVAALAVAGGLIMLARLPLAGLRHRLLHVEGFLLLLLALLPFTTPGETLFAIGPFAASKTGLLHAVTLAVTINACTLAVFGLLGGLQPVQLGHAAARLGVPAKLVHLFLFLVRYVGLFRAEAERLLDAMRARGFVPRSTRHGWRSLGNLAGMLLVRSLERAERVDEAMRCRGFSGRLPLLSRSRFGHADLAFVAAALVLLAATLAADRLT